MRNLLLLLSLICLSCRVPSGGDTTRSASNSPGTTKSGSPGPVAPATKGYIHLVRDQGVWWFEDGAGKRFFSLGVACVAGCFGGGEESSRKLADKAAVLSLLRRWGFNTAGAWSSPGVWDDIYFAEQIYPSFNVGGEDEFDEAAWNGPRAAEIQEKVKPFLGQKNLIGYFLDNEPGWDSRGLFEYHVRLAPSRPGSQALIAFLKKYFQNDIGVLNKTWGSSHKSFDVIAGSQPPKSYPYSMGELLESWKIEVISAHYRHYSALVRRFDPDHLILGIRFAGVPDIAMAKALAPYWDVFSINDYNRYGNVKPDFAKIYEATGKPLLNSEWSFSGFPTPGYRSLQFVDVYSQENRGYGYQKYVLEAARAPFMVGTHFFLWEDYGKWDGSWKDTTDRKRKGKGKWKAKGDDQEMGFLPDNNMGLVATGGKPYEEFGSWCQKTNAEVSKAHLGAVWKPTPEPEEQYKTLKSFLPKLDGDTSEWPSELGLRPWLSNALRKDRASFEHTYFISWDEKNLYLGASVTDSRLDHPIDPGYSWEGDFLQIYLEPSVPPDKKRSYFAGFMILPMGRGADRQQPYAVPWGGSYDGPLNAPVFKKTKPGGYVLEASIPTSVINGFPGKPGTEWKVSINYQNVNEIYETIWRGTVRFAKQ